MAIKDARINAQAINAQAINAQAADSKAANSQAIGSQATGSQVSASSSSGSAVLFYAPSAESRAKNLLSLLAEQRNASAGSREDGWIFSSQPLSREALAQAFVRGSAIIGLCSAAILLRSLPISHKHRDSPLLCLASSSAVGGKATTVDCKVVSIVSLLGWHHGGARLARLLGAALALAGEEVRIVGGSASEERWGFALEDMPRGWLVEGDIDKTLKSLARGVGYSVVGEACAGFPPRKFFANAEVSMNSKQASSNKTRENKTSGNKKRDSVIRVELGYRARVDADIQIIPRRVSLGIGCIRGACADDISSLVASSLDEAGVARSALCGVASVLLKRDERGLLQFAKAWGLPLRFFSASHLQAMSALRGLTGNDEVERVVGSPSVAEAAALSLVSVSLVNVAGDGMDAELLLGKRKSSVATCALAIGDMAFAASDLAGEKNGYLKLVGLGPGGAMLRTAEAELALREADVVVGYAGYFPLLEQGETRADVKFIRHPIGEEEVRCRAAIACARRGQNTVLLGSGDTGVYGLATLLWQLLAQEKIDANTDANTRDSEEKARGREEVGGWESDAAAAQGLPIEVMHVAGISAMYALAARVGAPLADDFCAISLSDVMTPEEKILKRVTSAASGDFVLALYNPQSETRRKLLPRALDILREHRALDTPIALGRLVGRKDEEVRISALGEFRCEVVDMHTILIVGNSQTRLYRSPYGNRLYTQRGYRLVGASSCES